MFKNDIYPFNFSSVYNTFFTKLFVDLNYGQSSAKVNTCHLDPNTKPNPSQCGPQNS
jgi:hypothetical protein